jgi:hypothetical protein
MNRMRATGSTKIGRVAVLFIWITVMACASEEVRPDGLLPREEFKDLLLEAQLIEARLNFEMVDQKRHDMPVRQYYAELFKARNTTEQAFKTTFTWYTEHPAELKAIYTEVLADLRERAGPADTTAAP